METVQTALANWESLFDQSGDRHDVPEVHTLRDRMRDWRFYADFRTDADAPARASLPATRTPVLHHDGRDLAAALQTIQEIGDSELLKQAIDDAFPGSQLVVHAPRQGWLEARLLQPCPGSSHLRPHAHKCG